MQLCDQHGRPLFRSGVTLRVIQWYTARYDDFSKKVKLLVAAPQQRPDGLAPIPNTLYDLARDRVFTTPEADVLIAAAYDLHKILNDFTRLPISPVERHAVLFVGARPGEQKFSVRPDFL